MNTYLRVVRAVESLGEIGGFRKWHATEAADETASNDALLATKDANLETRVLRSLEHLVSMKTIERFCRVLTGNGAVDEDGSPTRMQVSEA